MQTLAGRAFEQGQHICALYDTRDEQIDVAAAYIADGLDRGERCLYAPDSAGSLPAFRSRLRKHGIDAGEKKTAGALLVLTKEQAHLIDGRFDSERMLAMLNRAAEDALNDGYSGLRTCGDMSWLLDDAPGAEHVVEYEALLNQFFRAVRGLGMCQYDRSRLPAGLLDHAGLCAHSSVVIGRSHKDNPFFTAGHPCTAFDPAAVEMKMQLLARA
jgi:two-component system, chemotaxis family, sensor kinase Cph1